MSHAWRPPRWHLRAALAAAFALQDGAVTAEAAGVFAPPANGGYDSQLGGAYPPAAGVTVVSRDREEAPAVGLYSICYVNAFQTQALEAGWWKQNNLSAAAAHGLGSLCRGRQLAGRDPARHVERGEARCDPGHRRSMDRADAPPTGSRRSSPQSLQLDPLARQATPSDRSADGAHDLRSRAPQWPRRRPEERRRTRRSGRRLGGLDFAVVESCRQFDECDGYMAVYGDRVFAIEYPAADADHFAEACAAHGDRISTAVCATATSPPAIPAYRIDSC